MTGLEQVKAAVAAALNKAGVRAVLEYGPERAKCYDGAVISVGVRKSECRQAGLCDYLGEQEDPETGLSRELYGRRLELSLSLDAGNESVDRDTAGGKGALVDMIDFSRKLMEVR